MPTSISSSRSARANCSPASRHSCSWRACGAKRSGRCAIASEQYQTLLNQAPIGVYVVDADFRIREVNPIALPCSATFRVASIGRDFDEIIHLLWERDYADEIVRIFRHTLATGEPYVTAERVELRLDRGVDRILRVAARSHHAAGRTLRVGLLLPRHFRAEDRRSPRRRTSRRLSTPPTTRSSRRI